MVWYRRSYWKVFWGWDPGELTFVDIGEVGAETGYGF